MTNGRNPYRDSRSFYEIGILVIDEDSPVLNPHIWSPEFCDFVAKW